MNPLLEIDHLTLSFNTPLGKAMALNGVSFQLNKGEFVAIAGESGSGKSTLAHAIMGLTPKHSSRVEGKVLFEGKNLLLLDQKEMERYRGKHIGMIFQDPMTALNPTMHVGKQIIEAILKHQKIDKKSAEAQTIELLERVGIQQARARARQYPHELSGGMRQRVVIAIAMACKPALILADEPTTALDVTLRKQVLDILKEVQKALQTTILLISHDLSLIAGYAERLMIMYAGKIVEAGNVDEIYATPQHPYTQALLQSIPRLDMSKERALKPIQGAPPSAMQPFAGCPFALRCPHAMRICPLKPPPQLEAKKHHIVSCWLHHARTS